MEFKKRKGVPFKNPWLKWRVLKQEEYKMLRTERNILVQAARRELWPPWLHFGGNVGGEPLAR